MPKRREHRLKKIRLVASGKWQIISFALVFAVIGGVVALLVTRAAVPLVEDSSIPRPQNVKIFPDDQSLIVTWDDTRPSGVIGYYLKYKKKGASSWEGIKQTIHNSVQLQPLENGAEYEVTVQSARGSYLQTDKGSLVNHDSFGPMYWARADGHVSPAVTVSGTASAARVAAMRNRLTGFFDEFNEPANPFNELKWNNASFCDYENTSSAFINNQFHSHNAVSCTFGGTISRPRSTFDTSVGVNGGPVSETNPALIEFDMDIGVDGRSKWYLDLVPLSARTGRYPLDMDGHHTADDSQDHEDPGNMLRFEVGGSGVTAGFNYWDKNRNFNSLWSWEPPSTCANWSRDWGDFVDFRVTDGCPTSNKTLVPASPLPEQNLPLLMTAQNVRRHWVMQFTPTKVKVFVDGTQIMQATLPAEWAAEKKYTLQNTMFSYNTAKGFSADSSNMARRGIIPYFHFYHWDNFGFTGPAATTEIHNYVDGGSDGKSPKYLNNNEPRDMPRTTNIKIPDEIGSPTNVRLYLTIASRLPYNWKLGDNVVINGHRYDFPSLTSQSPNPPPFWDGEIWNNLIPVAINVNKADLKKGDNIVIFNIIGEANAPSAINVHLELEYPKGSAPSFTQPIDIYGQAFSNIVEPKMSNCDQYIYVEQDLGLPKLNNAANLEPAPCYLLSTMPSHSGHTDTPTPIPNPDIINPTVNLTAPANNTTLSGNTVSAEATASDNVGINRVEFYVGGTRVATDTSSPYAASLDFTSYTPGSYSVYAIAYDTSDRSAQTSSVNVIKPQPQDTTKPTITAFSPPNSTSVAADATSLDLTVNATDNIGVTRVDFVLDSATIGFENSPSSGTTFRHTINPASLQAGDHIWRVEVRDAAGNLTVSNNWTFTSTTPTTDPDPDPGPDPDPIPDPNPNPNKPGDINGDGQVNVFDLSVLLSHYGQTVPANTNGDLTGDGRVNVFDLSVLLSNYGK